jgi:predicted Zn-dependent protease
VLVGERFPGLAYEEAAFAAAIAHEMAHNILRHPQTFHEIGWKRKLVRLSERDADRLMPWLLQNAGYDPQAAIAFMRRWGPKHGGWIFRKRSHDGWDERVEFIEAELTTIEAAKQSRTDGRADWSMFFKQELPRELPEK